MTDDQTDAYRFIGGNHYHRGERLEADEVIEPTERELEAFGQLFVPVDDAEAADESESDEDDGDSGGGFDAAAFVDRTPMQEVVDDIRSGDYDDRLDAIKQAEQARRDRNGVTSAIDDRRDETDTESASESETAAESETDSASDAYEESDSDEESDER